MKQIVHRRTWLPLAALVAISIALTACSGSAAPTPSTTTPATATEAPSSASTPAIEDLTGDGPATLWVRAADVPLDQKLVDGWNQANPTRTIELVAIPDGEYVQKFIQASRSGDVPDIAVIDIANATTLTSQGLLRPITGRVASLPYADKLAPAAMSVCQSNGETFCIPNQLDIAVMYYNKDLFAKAGLDPNKPPTTNAEIRADAAAITKLGGDTYGFYFAGNCAGCNAYTTLPMIWASGGDILSSDNSKSTPNDPAVVATLDLLKGMWDDGSIPKAAQDETGATWLNSFMSGQIGIINLGSFGIDIFKGLDGFNFGMAPIPGVNGGQGAFLGGDIVGIPAAAKQAKTAWDFLEWTTTPDVQQQIVAPTHLVIRSDLVDNPTTSANVLLHQANQLITIAKVPTTTQYNALFIDPASPFLQMIRDYVFQNKPDALTSAQKNFDQRING